MGALAIDDIKLTNGECPSFGSCSFEGDSLCKWQNVYDSRDDFDWEIGTHKTTSFDTGPT